MAEDVKAGSDGKGQAAITPKVTWDDSELNMSYANVVNVTSTREEVTLFFGTNLTWNASDTEYRVKLSDRIVVNPFAAKRLLTLLAGILKEYENKFGVIEISALNPQKPDKSS